ncbi:hypothetical protein BA059_05205 [Mycolicibacterium sp. (ex Dasyatis americana)]|nr:hypothetical protein BA059_05205 [Mycolicibacterium sp. (ex Dasyatis americana)]
MGIIGTVVASPVVCGAAGAAGAWLDDVVTGGAWGLLGPCWLLSVPHAAVLSTSAAATGNILCKHFMSADGIN